MGTWWSVGIREDGSVFLSLNGRAIRINNDAKLTVEEMQQKCDGLNAAGDPAKYLGEWRTDDSGNACPVKLPDGSIDPRAAPAIEAICGTLSS